MELLILSSLVLSRYLLAELTWREMREFSRKENERRGKRWWYEKQKEREEEEDEDKELEQKEEKER